MSDIISEAIEEVNSTVLIDELHKISRSLIKLEDRVYSAQTCLDGIAEIRSSLLSIFSSLKLSAKETQQPKE